MGPLKNIIRVGIVSSINPTKATARVAFEDQSSLVSYELPVLVWGSLKTKDYWMPDPGEQVLCLFLPSGAAQGFILGSFYSEKDKPPVTSKDKRHITFPDGTVIEYDSASHKLLIDAKGPVEVKTSDTADVTANTASISAPKGVTISATDSDGTGVQINGKNNSESW